MAVVNIGDSTCDQIVRTKHTHTHAQIKLGNLNKMVGGNQYQYPGGDIIQWSLENVTIGENCGKYIRCFCLLFLTTACTATNKSIKFLIKKKEF